MQSIEIDGEYAQVMGYKTPAEAIRAEKTGPRAERSRAESPLIAGSFIDSFRIDDSVTIALSNGRQIEIFDEQRRTGWRISELDSTPVTPNGKFHKPVRLIWSPELHSVWDPVGLLERRRIHPLRGLFAGRMFLNLYFEGIRELMFVPVLDRSTSRSFIQFEEL
jgi:hypothetical protein